MSDAALIILDYGQRTATPTERAEQLKEAALATSGLIGRVASAEDNARAVEAQQAVKGVVDLIEKARTVCKRPIIDIGKAIEDTARKMTHELALEMYRVGKLISDFQALELKKARAAEAERLAELSRLEKEREAAIAKATTHEEVEKIQERSNAEASLIAPAPVPVRAEGQSVVEVVKIDRISEFELMKARPDLVRKVEFDLLEIKALCKAGVKLQGVTFHMETESRVRGSKEAVMIEM